MTATMKESCRSEVKVEARVLVRVLPTLRVLTRLLAGTDSVDGAAAEDRGARLVRGNALACDMLECLNEARQATSWRWRMWGAGDDHGLGGFVWHLAFGSVSVGDAMKESGAAWMRHRGKVRHCTSALADSTTKQIVWLFDKNGLWRILLKR